MKQLLISIKPEEVEKILNDEKTILILKRIPTEWMKYLADKRNTAPEDMEVFIYCSKGKKDYHLCKLYKDNKYPYYTYESYEGCELMPEPMDGKVIAKFKLRNADKLTLEYYDMITTFSNIKLVKFDEDGEAYDLKVASNDDDNPNDNWLCKQSCLTYLEIAKYIGEGSGTEFYAIHIDDLQILDKPFSLSENKLVNPTTCVPIKEAPSPWNYCEYIDDKELPF